MKIFKTLLFIILTLSSFSLFASTKKVDRWKYEPERKGNTDILDIIADRTTQTSILDQVIDNTNIHDVIEETERRKATVNASSDASRKAMGSTMRNRIFNSVVKGGLWGTAGVYALQSLLDGVGWIIDPESQSIWRNKKPDPNSTIGCSGGYRFKTASVSGWFPCPLSAANAWVNYANTTADTGSKYTFVKFQNDPYTANPIQFTVHYEHSKYPSLSKDMPNQQMQREKDPNVEPEKEILTDDKIADYMLGKAKDSPEPGKHTSVNDAFKPDNAFEYDKNPAVQIAKHAIENGTQIQNETDTNTDVNTKPDGSGFQLPKFCTWAKYVCDFIDWTKKDPEKEEKEQPEPDDKGIFSKKFNAVFSLSNKCPPDIPFNLDTEYLKGNFSISLNWLCIFFTFIGYPLQLVSHFMGLWILYEAVIRKEIKW